MDGEEIIIVSCSDSSDFEVVSVSSDEAETNAKLEAGKIFAKATETGRSKSAQKRKKRLREKSQQIIPSSKKEKKLNPKEKSCSKSCKEPNSMTCLREQIAIPPVKHKYDNKKSWSQNKKEKEDRKCLPPACKRARLNLPELAPKCSSSKLGRTITITDDEDEFSDDLPDLDLRQKTPEHHPAYSSGPAVTSSPIVLSSDDDVSNTRLGIFASLSATSDETVSKPEVPSLDKSVQDKKETSLNKRLLLTDSARNKMAAIFGNVLRQNKTTLGRPQSPSEYSDVSSNSSKPSSTGSRHFMDAVFQPNENARAPSPVPSLSDVSDSSQIDIDDSDSDSDGDGDSDSDDDEYQPDSDTTDCEISKPVSLCPSQSVKKNAQVSAPKMTRTVSFTNNSSNSAPRLDIRKFFPSKPCNSYDKVSLEGRSSHLISYHSQYVTEEDELAASLTHLHVNTVDAALEEGEKFLEYGLDLVSDFSSRLKPTDEIVSEILEKSLLGTSCIRVSYKTFKLLSQVWQKYPSCIHIDWDLFTRVMGNLSLEKGRYVTPTEFIVKGSLYVQLVIQALETDLYKRNLHNLAEIRRALAYQYLSVDTSYTNLKQIVYWVGSIITSEYKDVSNPEASQSKHMWSCIDGGCVPKVLPNLQKLLHLGIQVSRNCVDAAKRISCELVRTYIYLSDIQCKKLFLQTLSSDLLRFKVTQRLLEDHCDGTSLCCEDFPVSLKQVVEAYYQASPPRSLVTPPQSPSDDEGPGVHGAGIQQYSTASCEELAMLVYINTQSYLQCAQTAEYEPLAQQSGHKQNKHFSFVSSQDQQTLREAVDELHGHMLQLTSELNSTTHTYLFMMKCLGNLH
ncbi:LOW QUALITY PROTEIN: uncharacterized protein LOC124278522 [Haliotis rubra]|uniref:LOW QUALITY PROTEIN: uncharacterized protein LOC124278522 n=1 Tax=Haliotis rubra TaxID=36100 RepID=UPI001EE60405|nr:LOW QUALITY PROTEIN: uncharacterized protein LOC124278522 [Haliotis rubra]